MIVDFLLAVKLLFPVKAYIFLTGQHSNFAPWPFPPQALVPFHVLHDGATFQGCFSLVAVAYSCQIMTRHSGKACTRNVLFWLRGRMVYSTTPPGILIQMSCIT